MNNRNRVNSGNMRGPKPSKLLIQLSSILRVGIQKTTMELS